MADKVVAQVTLSADGKTAVILYKDGSTESKSASAASKLISQARLGGHLIQQSAASAGPSSTSGGIPAFGTSSNNGGSTNSTSPVKLTDVITKDNINALAALAGSSKSDGYAKVRKLLLGAGIISKGTRSLQAVQNAWSQVLVNAQNEPTGALDVVTYLNNIKKQGVGEDTASNQGPTDYSQITVWDPTKAKDYITQLSTDILKREPTSQEIDDIKVALEAAQKKNPSKTVYTKDKSGKTVATTTGGLDEQQFITDLLKKNPDYAKVKEAGTASAIQQVKDAAKANGITTLDPEQLAAYAERIRNGEKIDDITSMFRKIAAISQPKPIADLLNTGLNLSDIYAPYKSAMAKTLEIDPNTIDITDPSLSKAITGDKTMTTYEFQRALRQDPRWQYTNGARDEVATAATQVLKDFGFMG